MFAALLSSVSLILPWRDLLAKFRSLAWDIFNSVNSLLHHLLAYGDGLAIGVKDRTAWFTALISRLHFSWALSGRGEDLSRLNANSCILGHGASLNSNLPTCVCFGIKRLKEDLITTWSKPYTILWTLQAILALVRPCVVSTRLIVDLSSPYILVIVPLLSKLTKPRLPIISIMGLASPCLSSVTVFPPHRISCLLKSPVIIISNLWQLFFSLVTA